MGIFVLSLFCLLSLTCFGYSTNKQMICRDVGDLTNADVDTQRLVSTRGKQGIKGERGLTGQPGIVDYDEVKEIVRLNVENETHPHGIKVDTMEEQIKNLTSQISETRQLRIKVDEMKTQLQDLKSQTSETRQLQIKVDEMKIQILNLTSQISVLSCVHGVKHEGICYWAELPSSFINHNEAEKICTNKGSRLADIYGKNHFEKIMNFLRGKLNGEAWIYVWTGMKKLHYNNIAQLSNGSPAPYTHQRRHFWNYNYGRHNYVYLKVNSSTSDTDQGMGANAPTWYIHGALCQTE